MNPDPSNTVPKQASENKECTPYERDRMALGDLSQKIEMAYNAATDPDIKADLWDEWMCACDSAFMLEILAEETESLESD
jgi:hypothetical protein